MPIPKPNSRRLAWGAAALLASTALLWAEPKTWTGAGATTSWATAGNWSPSALLNGGVDGVVFDASSGANLTQTLGQNWVVTNFMVGDVSGPVTIAAGNVLTITNSSAIKGKLDLSAATADVNIYANITISNTQPSVLVGEGRTLTLSNIVHPIYGVRGPGTVRVLGSGYCLVNLTNRLTLLVDGGTLTNKPNFPMMRLTAGADDRVQVVVTNNGKIMLTSSATKFILGGYNGTGTNVLRVESGSVQINGSGGSAGNALQVGDNNGTGILDINGGTVTIAHQTKGDDNLEGYLDVPGGNGSGTGIVNLNGGRLAAARIKTTSYGNGTFNFNGGTLAANWNAGDTWFSGLTRANVQAGGAIIDTANYNVAIAQNLEADSPNGGLTKQGAGNLTLAGVCSYTGPTLVSAGTLSISGNLTGNGALTVADNAGLVLNMSGLGSFSSLSVSSLDLGSAGNVSLNFNYGTVFGNPSTPAITASSALTAAAANILLTIQGSGFTVGSFPLIRYGGTPLASLANFSLSLPPGVMGRLVNNTAERSIDLEITALGNVNYLTWYGGVSADWDLATYNWNLGGSSYQQTGSLGDVVTFDDSLEFIGLHTNVNLTTALHPFSVTVSNTTAKGYIFSGAGKLSGNTSLLKLGGGTLTIATANDFAGGTTLSNGTVQVGHNAALGVGSVLFAAGKICSDDGAARTLTNRLVLAGNPAVGDLVNNGVLTFGGLLDINSPAAIRTLTVNSEVVVTGGSTNGALQKMGAGTLSFVNCTNWWGTYSAYIFNGTVALTNAYMSTASSLRPECNVANGLARLIIGPGSVWENASGAGNFRIAGGNSGASSSATNICDVLGIVRCTNPTNFANGDMLFDKDRNSFVNLYAGGLVYARSVRVINTGSGYHEFNFDGGTLSATPTSTNAVYMQDLSACYLRAGGGTIDTTNMDLTIAQALLDGGGNGGLTKRGSGTLILTGANTYTGPTVVSSGTLVLNQNHAGSGSVTVANGAKLGFLSEVAGGTVLVPSATVNGTLSVAFSNQSGLPTGAAAYVNALTLNGTVTVDVTSLPEELPAGASIPLIRYDTLTGAVATRQLPAGISGTIVNDSANRMIKLVIAAPSQPQIGTVSVSGANLVFNGSGGPTGGGHSYYVLSATDVAAPLNNWVRVATNQFNADGTFTATVPVSSAEPQRFYRLQLP